MLCVALWRRHVRATSIHLDDPYDVGIPLPHVFLRTPSTLGQFRGIHAIRLDETKSEHAPMVKSVNESSAFLSLVNKPAIFCTHSTQLVDATDGDTSIVAQKKPQAPRRRACSESRLGQMDRTTMTRIQCCPLHCPIMLAAQRGDIVDLDVDIIGSHYESFLTLDTNNCCTNEGDCHYKDMDYEHICDQLSLIDERNRNGECVKETHVTTVL